jgi:hypothetical protein
VPAVPSEKTISDLRPDAVAPAGFYLSGGCARVVFNIDRDVIFTRIVPGSG